jgi:polar amino acid transport system ATP-binding protein
MMATATETPMISVRGLTKSYGDLHVLRGLDLDVPAGQVVSIIGSSGSGKSTLLRVLMTLERPNSGRILIQGEPLFTMEKNGSEVPASEAHLRRVRQNITMVFQHFNLFPHMSVIRNVAAAPIHVQGVSKNEAMERARMHLEQVGLGDKVDAYPAQLSGGQKQRVAIARALAINPKIMLFDEITSALDPELVGGILDLLRELGNQHTTTMLIVTHEMNFARDSSDRVLMFDQGVILEDNDPKTMFSNPREERTREFLQSVL